MLLFIVFSFYLFSGFKLWYHSVVSQFCSFCRIQLKKTNHFGWSARVSASNRCFLKHFWKKCKKRRVTAGSYYCQSARPIKHKFGQTRQRWRKSSSNSFFSFLSVDEPLSKAVDSVIRWEQPAVVGLGQLSHKGTKVDGLYLGEF